MKKRKKEKARDTRDINLGHFRADILTHLYFYTPLDCMMKMFVLLMSQHES